MRFLSSLRFVHRLLGALTSYVFLKELFDRIAAFCLLILLFPLWLIIAFLILCSTGLPIYFVQPRAGQNGRIFALVKFRTMTSSNKMLGLDAPDEVRITRLGRFLRALSLDEIPQLINILRGDMSFIGPRPLLVHYLPLYSDEQNRRHLVKPGLSGWAQVNGRNALSWEEKFRFDVWYVDRQNFLFDLRISFLTIWKVFLREGISPPGDATMPPFTGTPPR